MNDKELKEIFDNLTKAIYSITEALVDHNERLKAVEKAIKKIDSGVI